MNAAAKTTFRGDAPPSQHIMAPMVQSVLVPVAWIVLGMAIDRFLIGRKKPAA